MRKLFALALFCCSCLFGQGSNTTVGPVQVITNSSTDPTLSSIVQNTGQPFHLAYANFSDAPTKTCAVVKPGTFGIPLLQIFASFDGTNFFDITNTVRPLNPQVTGAATRYRLLVTASGTYNYIKVQVGLFDSANCLVNVWYSGGWNSVDITKAFNFNSNYSDGIANFNFDISSASTTSLIATNTFCQWAIYGLTLYNSTTANTITFFETRTDSANVTWVKYDTVALNTLITLPNTGVPYYQTTVGATFKLTTSGAGPVSGSLEVRCQ